jgi:hypothetical protein
MLHALEPPRSAKVIVEVVRVLEAGGGSFNEAEVRDVSGEWHTRGVPGARTPTTDAASSSSSNVWAAPSRRVARKERLRRRRRRRRCTGCATMRFAVEAQKRGVDVVAGAWLCCQGTARPDPRSTCITVPPVERQASWALCCSRRS